jgi:hypothetical protein
LYAVVGKVILLRQEDFLLLIGHCELKRFAADRKIEIAGRVMNRIPDGFGVQALQAEMPQIRVARVNVTAIFVSCAGSCFRREPDRYRR